jgi:hypothetical protein
MAKPERRDPAKEQFWRTVFAQWQHSGLTGRDFCSAHRLKEASFYSWRRELARRDQQTAVAVSPGLPPSPPPQPAFLQFYVDPDVASPAVEVVLVHGRRLLVRPGFDVDLLRQVLRVLEEPAC